MYFIKNLEDCQSIPSIFKDEVIFEQAFEKAELAKLDSVQSESYESSLKEYRDIKGYIDTAYDDGKQEGILEGKQEGRAEGKQEEKRTIAKSLKLAGVNSSIIRQSTGLSDEEIEEL